MAKFMVEKTRNYFLHTGMDDVFTEILMTDSMAEAEKAMSAVKLKEGKTFTEKVGIAVMDGDEVKEWLDIRNFKEVD